MQAEGTILVAPGEVRIKLDDDFCLYYRKLWAEHMQIGLYEFNLPRYGAHMTVVSKKIHTGIDTSPVEFMHQSKAAFDYDVDIQTGGKLATSVYARVQCPAAVEIKRLVGIVDPPTFLGLHITICNNKNKNDGHTK